jgi:hypothetical protein
LASLQKAQQRASESGAIFFISPDDPLIMHKNLYDRKGGGGEGSEKNGAAVNKNK